MKRMLTSLLLVLALPLAAQEAAKQEPPTRIRVLHPGAAGGQEQRKPRRSSASWKTLQKTLNDKLQAKAEEGQTIQQQLQSASLSERRPREAEEAAPGCRVRLQEAAGGQPGKVHQGPAEGARRDLPGGRTHHRRSGQGTEAPGRASPGESAQAGQLIQWADEKWIQEFTLEVAKRLDASTATPTANQARHRTVPAKPVPPTRQARREKALGLTRAPWNHTRRGHDPWSPGLRPRGYRATRCRPLRERTRAGRCDRPAGRRSVPGRG